MPPCNYSWNSSCSLWFKSDKSSGPDNIGPKLLKIILYNILEPLEHICNLSFTTSVVPSKLKVASYSSLQKGDKGKPDNYTSQYPYLVFDKLFEKLTYNRLYNVLQTYDILYKYQFGFRRCNSTSLALIEIVDNIYIYMQILIVVIILFVFFLTWRRLLTL